ncbi:MAG: N utilization substance protein B [Alphaproteobacteria bacterium]|jgi:N utilization substance protein B
MNTLDDLIKDDFDANEHDAFPDAGSITGDSRTEARILALQAIFQHIFVNQPLSKVRDEFIQFYVKQQSADKKIMVKILDDVTDNQERYEKIIASNLNENWTYDRIGLVEKSLLMAAVSELSAGKTPIKVILNEYINISKGYFDSKEVGFINGILDNLAIIIREPDSEKAQELVSKNAQAIVNVEVKEQNIKDAIAKSAKEKIEIAEKKKAEAIAAALLKRAEKRAKFAARDEERDQFERKKDYELNNPGKLYEDRHK